MPGVRMDTSARDCLVLFDTSVEGRLKPGWEAGVLHQRTKTTKAGPMVYVECFPVWDTRSAQAAKAEARREAHRRAQQKLNERNVRRKLDVLVNANFGAGDLIITATYAHGRQPEGEARAHRDIVNYLSRIKYLRGRRGLAPLRYIYITEVTQSAQYGVRYHHHVILSGDGITRDEAEACWTRKHGGICNAKRCQPTQRHLTGFSRYLTQDKRGRSAGRDGRNPQARAMRRSFNPSKNLVHPQPSVADKKISIRKAGRIAETVADFDRAKAIFARLYPDCELLEVAAWRSPWAAGVYVRAELRRVQKQPERRDKR